MKAVASAPGKVILTGEHFVVYGEPALAMAINLYAKVSVSERLDDRVYISSNLGVSGFFEDNRFSPEIGGNKSRKILEPIKISAEAVLKSLGEKRGLNIEVTSTIPVAAGLGSSSASAVSTVAAVGRLFGAKLTKESVINLSTEAERYVHVNPSGIDQSISTYGGVISYKKNEEIVHLKIKSAIPVVIGNSGVVRNTGKLIDKVHVRMESLPDVMELLIKAAGKLTTRAIDALKIGNIVQLGLLMDVSQGFLTALGVSSEAIDKLIYAAKRGGALGAKITGAGGGGCIVALTHLDERKKVAQSISAAGGIPIISENIESGVRSWIMR